MGYSGQKCEIASVTVTPYLSEMFQSPKVSEMPGVTNVSNSNATYYELCIDLNQLNSRLLYIKTMKCFNCIF